jgi:hypothetical protein
MPNLTATVAIGDLKLNPVRFEAREVRAGSSVAGGTLDVVTGNVTARTGDTVTVRGATLMRTDGSVVFNDTVTVTLADTTVVRRQLSLSAYAIDDISVGQRVAMFGTITNEDVNNLEMDASTGYAHMLYTALHGRLSGAPVAPAAVVDLGSIDLRRTDLFDFAGTGTAAADDADPAAYEVDTGTLDLSGLADGTPVRMLGFVKMFGEAPPDFEAHTVVDLSNAYVMRVTWNPPRIAAVAQTADDAITLNLNGAGILHHVFSIVGTTDLTLAVDPPTIAAPAADLGLYLIGQGSTLQVYLSFQAFSRGLQEQLDAGATVRAVVARGYYDDVTTTITAGLVGVALR